MNKTILITGGAGFIGSNIAKRCINEGYKIVIVDNLLTGNLNNVPEEADFINMDISQEDQYMKLSDLEFDAVFHLAAQSSGEISNEKPELDLSINALGTLLLLRWSMKKKITRFLYASSMAVYGNVQKVPVSETEVCLPLSFYGISKLTGEHYVRHFSKEGLNTTCFRMFSVYGPGQDMKNLKQGMVSIFMAHILNGEFIHVKGSKERFRDFIYIDDVVNAWLKVLNEPKSFGKTYNLGAGKRISVYKLIQDELEAFGLPKTYPVKYEGTTPCDQFGLYADISELEKDTGWKPEYSLEEGLSRMSKWVKTL